MTTTALQQIFDKRKLTHADVAQALGLTRQAVQRWASGINTPRPNTLMKLAEYLNLPVEQILGNEPIPELGAHSDRLLVERLSDDVPEGFTRMPLLSAIAECGDSTIEADGIVVGAVDFSDAFLRSLVGVTGIRNRFQIIGSTGDSMEPTITRHAFCVLDTNQREILTDGIYCIQVENQLWIKRVQCHFDHSITLISDNDRYRPMTYSRENLEHAQVIGRVVFVFNGIPT